MPQAKLEEKDVLTINRREFMTYAWGAALGLVALEGTGATLWFAYPRFKEGEFGGVFTVTNIPEVGVKPDENLAGKFYFTNTECASSSGITEPAEVKANQLPHGIKPEASRHHGITIKMAVKKPESWFNVQFSLDDALAVLAGIVRNVCDTIKHEHVWQGQLCIAGAK